MKALLLLLLLVGAVQAQTTVSITKETALIGLENVRLIGNLVLTSNTKNFKLMEVGIVSITSEASSVTIEAEDINRKALDVKPLPDIGTTKNYGVEGTGRIWIEVTCIDFPKAIYFRSKKDIELLAVDQPENDISLSVTGKAAKTAIVRYANNMGRDYETTANNVAANRYTTVTQANNATYELTLKTKELFQRDIATIMQPLLGGSTLPASAASTYSEMGKGFLNVK